MAKVVLSSDDGDPVEKVLQSVELLKARHTEVKSLTDSLTTRIKQFEDWVATLPGRVETSITMEDPNHDPEYELFVYLERTGKNWTLQYAHIFRGDYEDVKLEPLVNAGVKIKAYVLPALPRLIESMVQSQQYLVTQIESANKAFDAFAARMKMPAKEGE